MKLNTFFVKWLCRVLFSSMLQYPCTCFAGVNEISIPFLSDVPVIDGRPAEGETDLVWNKFGVVSGPDGPGVIPEARFAFASNQDYLYLIIEAGSDSITVRDRAYQNGDGFHLVIGDPFSGTRSNEFFVLRFSPADPARGNSSRSGVWYYNTVLSSASLSRGTLFNAAVFNNKSYFELLLPWKEVHPYNPLSGKLPGLNLCFVKATGSGRVFYYLEYDELIQAENSSRLIVPVSFSGPPVTAGGYICSATAVNNVSGGRIRVRTTIVWPVNDTLRVRYSVRGSDGKIFLDRASSIPVVQGVNSSLTSFPAGSLTAGTYEFAWSCGRDSGKNIFTVLPEIDFTADRRRIAGLGESVSEGDRNTLRLMSKEIGDEIASLKSYETAENILNLYSRFNNDMNSLEIDPGVFLKKKGVIRRGFVSGLDSSLQPYSVRLPEAFEPGRKYPLFVMLHGSGSDDRSILVSSVTGGRFIEMAPFGRGTSNCFVTTEAIRDIREAIDDVMINFPVDTSLVIIGGFSMGGYGALRIYSEFPRLFDALAIFSGHPNLPSRWMGEGYPDYLDDDQLISFGGVPLFLFHSMNDLNCPYDLISRMAEKMTGAGARVTFLTSPAAGHSLIDKSLLPGYYAWLDKLLGN